MNERFNEKQLIAAMKKYCSDYHLYEYDDFLKIFKGTVFQLLQDKKDITLLNLGVFTTKQNPDKLTTHPKTGNRVFLKGRRTMRFKVSAKLNAVLNEKAKVQNEVK